MLGTGLDVFPVFPDGCMSELPHLFRTEKVTNAYTVTEWVLLPRFFWLKTNMHQTNKTEYYEDYRDSKKSFHCLLSWTLDYIRRISFALNLHLVVVRATFSRIEWSYYCGWVFEENRCTALGQSVKSVRCLHQKKMKLLMFYN